MRQQHEWKMEFIWDIRRRKLCQGLVIQITEDVVRLVNLAIVPEARPTRKESSCLVNAETGQVVFGMGNLSDRRGSDRGSPSQRNFLAQPHLQQFDFE